MKKILKITGITLLLLIVALIALPFLFKDKLVKLAKDEANKRTLYFAYGSNLSLAQMASRCPTSTHHALGVLHGYKWIIGKRGYANVIATSNPPNEVWGMLYWLEPEP